MTGRYLLAAAVVALGAGLLAAKDPAPATRPAGATPAPKKPADNMDFWLKQGKAAPGAATNPLDKAVDPFKKTPSAFSREDALPGVIEMSDGSLLPGGLYTTREKPWEVYSEKEKRWRQVPFVNVLSIQAVVLEERMEQRWRWKEMGVPERVYTGKEYPFRLFEWKFHLLDGTYLQGTVKGQPLMVEWKDLRYGPFILHERQSGQDGTTLKQATYIQRLLVSRRLMDLVVKEQAATRPKDM